MKKLSIASIIVLLALPLFASPGRLYAQAGTDPLSVANAYLAAFNAGDLNAVLATFADDAVETDLTPGPGDTGVVRGKDQLRASYTEFLQAHPHVDLGTPQVAGDKVTGTYTLSADFLKQLGVDSISGPYEFVVQGGKIKSLTHSASPASLAKVEAALQALAFAMPYQWSLVHVVLIGEEKNPSGVKVSMNGQDYTKAPDGSSITTTGGGAFDPNAKQAVGSGTYTIKDASGAVKAQGTYDVTGFVSFQRLPGGFPPGFQVDAPPPPPGEIPSAGLLTVNIHTDTQGDSMLNVTCVLPTTPNPGETLKEGVTWTGGNFNFTEAMEEAPTGLEATIFFTKEPPLALPGMPTTGANSMLMLSGLLILAALGLLGLGLVLRRPRRLRSAKPNR
jgi:hypothetical protein